MCYEHVALVTGKNEFSLEDNAVLEQMVQGRFLQAEVLSRESNGVPYINLYLVDNSQVRAALDPVLFLSVLRFCFSLVITRKVLSVYNSACSFVLIPKMFVQNEM